MGWKARRAAVGRANAEARMVRARPLDPNRQLANAIEHDDI